MSSFAAQAASLPRVYPQRADADPGFLDRILAPPIGATKRALTSRKSRYEHIVTAVDDASAGLSELADEQLHQMAVSLRPSLRSRRADRQAQARAFALVRELAGRTVGMRHYDVQLIGGWIMLQGMVAEMQTGEGKTLTATLPAAVAALGGTPVHIVSVNDYLVQRDAENMGPLYRSLGLTVGFIQEGMQPPERQQAYACDITYVSNKQIAFDYLRDRLAMGTHRGELRLRIDRLHSEKPRLADLVLPGLHFAIVDEVDSVLIDEARTPLIISRETDTLQDARPYEQALELAAQLEPGEDFEIDRAHRQIHLTRPGGDRLDKLSARLKGVWRSGLYREELCEQALSALHLYHRDRHYLVADDRVQIVDEFTGRVMADRSWQRGLHQMLEVKEGCELSSQKETLARISYQKFFSRYVRLAGMTGTAREIAGELWSVYDLVVATIPTRKPLQRAALPDRIFSSRERKLAAIVARVRELHERGRPVLIGTRSVAASEELSEHLTEAGLPHRVLNARNHAEEAEIVMEAGQEGRITVATNMAGRGTDIELGPGVAERGGLHVIGTEFHDARRIDRQLFGRTGRQGDPGSHEMIASLEDEMAVEHGGWLAQTTGGWRHADDDIARRLRSAVMRQCQRSVEARHGKTRQRLLKMEEQLSKALAFTGKSE